MNNKLSSELETLMTIVEHQDAKPFPACMIDSQPQKSAASAESEVEEAAGASVAGSLASLMERLEELYSQPRKSAASEGSIVEAAPPAREATGMERLVRRMERLEGRMEDRLDSMNDVLISNMATAEEFEPSFVSAVRAVPSSPSPAPKLCVVRV
eukprot:gnl/TRDRNA2_/TRDRNA2_171518_c1_seq2.p1 gnl/TRDRNA2_/TRDRNA2_171518_c1~~gnl/TRDRNA2_/TRDRNA2_171518_c1_seq2.p1  ORF type:complete len:155 (-),score=29.25 gnl/TRDRNA2_/TRDRNA2_171518_c1_seq2:149-613(-)